MTTNLENKSALIKGKSVYIATVQTNLIKTLHDSLSQIVTEAEWIFDNEGMKTIGLDSSKTMGIYVRLFASGFENGGIFYCEKNKTHRVGVNISNISALLKIMKDKDHVFHLYTEYDSPQDLHLVIDNSKVNSRRDITLTTIDCEVKDLADYEDNFNDQYDVVIGVPAVYFKDEIKYWDKIAKFLDITVHSGKSLSFDGVGSKMVGTSIKNSLASGSDRGIKFYHKTPGKNIITGRYSLASLAMFVKCTGLSSTSHVKLHMSMDEPLIVEYTIGELGEIKFCLAPE